MKALNTIRTVVLGAGAGALRPALGLVMTSWLGSGALAQSLDLEWLDGGHRGAARSVLVPTTLDCITVGQDGSVKLWDTATHDLLGTMGSLEEPSLALDTKPDGSQLALGTRGGTVEVWSTTTPASLTLSINTGSSVEDLAYHPSGASIAVATDAGSVALYNGVTGNQTLSLAGHQDPAVAVAFAGSNLLVSGDVTGKVIVWNLASSTIEAQWNAHDGPLADLGTFGGGSLVVTSGIDGLVRGWSIEGSLFASLDESPAFISAVDMTPDARFLIYGTNEGEVKVFDALYGNYAAVFQAVSTSVDAIDLVPATNTLIVCASDGGVSRWDLTTSTLLGEMSRPFTYPWCQQRGLPGNRMALGEQQSILLLNETNGAIAGEIATPWGASPPMVVFDETIEFNMTLGLDLSDSGSLLLGALADGTVRMWDSTSLLETLRVDVADRPACSAAFESGGARFVTGDVGGNLQGWDVSTGAVAWSKSMGSSALYCLRSAPSGSEFVAGDSSGELSVRSWATGTELLQLDGHDDAIVDIVFTTDGTRCITASAEGHVRLWDTSTWTLVEDFSTFARHSVAVATSPDSSQFLVGDADGSLQRFSTSSGSPLLLYAPETKPGIRTLSWTSDGVTWTRLDGTTVHCTPNGL